MLLNAGLREVGKREVPGKRKRFCVLIPKNPMMWDSLENRAEAYVVPVGY